MVQDEYKFGDDMVGLNLRMIQRDDVGSRKKSPAYSQDWFGSFLFYAAPSTLRFRECILCLDNTKSDTDIITTSISFSRLHFKINEISILISAHIGDERNSELLHSLSEPLGYSLNVMVEFVNEDSSMKSRQFATSIAYAVGDYGQSRRARLHMQHQSEKVSNFVLCGNLEMTTPKSDVVHREEFINEDMARSFIIQIGFGHSCDQDRKITIETRMERSEHEMTSTVQSRWKDRECSRQELFGRGVDEECLSTRRLASVLNKGIVTIDYNEVINR